MSLPVPSGNWWKLHQVSHHLETGQSSGKWTVGQPALGDGLMTSYSRSFHLLGP